MNAQDLQIQCLLEFEKLKLKISGSKRTIQPKQPSSSGQSAPAEKIIPEKKTFLPIDAILYPKETSNKKKQQQLKARQGQIVKAFEAAGLKGFGKAASRVSMLINEKQIEEMEKQIKSQNNQDGDTLTKEEIMEKNIERLIAQKKQPIKKFNNNPPKKEVPPPNTYLANAKKQKKVTNDEESGSDYETTTNNDQTAAHLKGAQWHPHLQAALGMTSMGATSVLNHQ